LKKIATTSNQRTIGAHSEDGGREWRKGNDGERKPGIL
jgi:hypothetical protein